MCKYFIHPRFLSLMHNASIDTWQLHASNPARSAGKYPHSYKIKISKHCNFTVYWPILLDPTNVTGHKFLLMPTKLEMIRLKYRRAAKSSWQGFAKWFSYSNPQKLDKISQLNKRNSLKHKKQDQNQAFRVSTTSVTVIRDHSFFITCISRLLSSSTQSVKMTWME